MPSTFRSSRSGRHLEGPNRTRTGQIDHDVFEGLPVRRWSRQPHTFSQAPKAAEDTEIGIQGPGGTTALPELPMPPDSGLLPGISKTLLRAARAGCIYIRQSARSADDGDEKMTDGVDRNAMTVHLADRSFTSRRWMTMSKNMEPPEVEFLAKRRPGLPSLYGIATDGSTPGPMRRTKFKKVDPETGNISVYEAWVPEGHRIEGEVSGDVQTIAEQSDVPVKPETPAPGTVVEGVGVVNSEGVVVAEAGSAAVMTPPKRRPPPPKRKGKGIGRGRKKKVMFAPGEGADAATVHNVAPSGEASDAKEGQDSSQVSVDQSGHEEEEDDGEEGDESDEGDESTMDAKTPETPQVHSGTGSTPLPSADTPSEVKDVDMADATPEKRPVALETATVSGQDTTSQTPAVPETPTTQPGASASAESLTAKKAEEVLEPPTSLSEQAPAVAAESSGPSTEMRGESEPKEESVAPEPIENAQEAALVATDEVKTETPALEVDSNQPAPVPTSPEKPQETPAESLIASETEQPAETTQQSQSAPATEAVEAQDPQAPETEDVKEPEVPSAPEPKAEVESGDAPAADPKPPQTEESMGKPASPTPPEPTESESPAPQPPITEPSAALDPTTDTKPEEPVSEPTAEQAEHAPEEKKEEPEAPAEPAPESA